MAESPKSKGEQNTDHLTVAIDVQVSVAGKTLTNSLLGVRLEQHIRDHQVLEAEVLADPEMQDSLTAKDAANALGQSLTLTAKPQGQLASGELDTPLSWTGVVTDVRLGNRVGQLNVIVLVAASPTVHLDSGPRNMLYANQSSDDVTSAVLSRYPVTVGEKKLKSVQYDYLAQYRESDYDFLLRVAAAAAAYVIYDGSKLHLVPQGTEVSTKLQQGVTLGAFTLRLGTAPVKFGSRSHDYVKNQQVSSSKTSKPSLNNLETKSASASESMFSEPGFAEAGTATDMSGLDRVVEHATSAAYAGAVRCFGESCVPKVTVGSKVNTKGVGDAAGEYLVENVKHVMSEGMYHNEFEGVAIGAAFPRPRNVPPKVTDLQSAVVVDLDDPDGYGRVKIKLVWFDESVPIWVRCAFPHAGDEHGWYSRPEVGDEVLVGFEQGDPNRPIVLGSLYNGKAKPALDDTKDNILKWFLTKSGHKIEFSDKSGDEKITVVTKDEACQIVLDAANKSISITSKGDVSISGGNITIDASEKLELKSGTDAHLKAGASLKVEATATADVKASGMMNLKGSMINLN